MFEEIRETLHYFGETYLGLSPRMTVSIVWTMIVWLLYLVIRTIVRAVVRKRTKDLTRQYLALKSTNYILGLFLLLALLRIWLGGGTGLAAYLGIVSAGLAIALQDPLTNLAGWLFITMRKPFVVGDRIQLAEHAGDVIDIRLFAFSMVEIGNWVDAEQSTGRIIHIPCGWVFKQTVANYVQGFNFIWNEIPVTVTFESNWERAKKLIADIGDKHACLHSDKAQQEVKKAARKYLIFFQHLTPIVWTKVIDNGVTLTLRYLCEPRTRRSTEGAIWEDILREFSKCDDIDFAYPTTRFYDNVSEGKPEARAPQPPERS